MDQDKTVELKWADDWLEKNVIGTSDLQYRFNQFVLIVPASRWRFCSICRKIIIGLNTQIRVRGDDGCNTLWLAMFSSG